MIVIEPEVWNVTVSSRDFFVGTRHKQSHVVTACCEGHAHKRAKLQHRLLHPHATLLKIEEAGRVS